MRLEITAEQDGLLRLRPEWDHLLSRAQPRPLPLTHAWLSAWWKAFSGGRQLRVSCVRDDANRLLAIAPLMKERCLYRGVSVSSLRLMVNGHSPFSGIVFDRSLSAVQIREVLKLLIETSSEDLIAFEKLAEADSTCSYLLGNLEQSGRRYGFTRSVETPWVSLDSDWDEFLGARSKKFRKAIRNKLNRFHRAGLRMQFELIGSSKHPALGEAIEVSSRSWKKSVGNDLHSNASARLFLLLLADAFGPDDGCHLWIARDGSRPVAYEMQIVFDSIAYPVRADFDESYRHLSPGSVVEYTAIKALFDSKAVRQYYTCADNYEYLSNWTSNTRRHINIDVFAPRLKSLLLHSLEYRAIPLLRSLRDRFAQRPIGPATAEEVRP